ncbi:unnamed protein product [Prorocentrum cordatum]|uniref:Uncharacterized protein n=1 Tax=Prorocentrum cordatum TaxID=2364126 RepID=A0ABN9VEA4_9DINO|nr:unnamed protein product [Polarella glacialis]
MLGQSLHAFGVDVDPFAVRRAVAPLAAVGPSIRPGEGALAVLLVRKVVAVVPGPVGPLHGAPAVHVAAQPLPAALPAVHARADAVAVHLIVHELPAVLDPSGVPSVYCSRMGSTGFGL